MKSREPLKAVAEPKRAKATPPSTLSGLWNSAVPTVRTIWGHWSTRGIVLFLAGYSVLQPVFDLPELFDAIKYLSGRTCAYDVGKMTLQGSVQILPIPSGDDSLVAWSETSCQLPIKIANNVKAPLRIDSILVRDRVSGTNLGFELLVEKGELKPYRDGYVVSGREEVDIVMSPMGVKGETVLLRSILNGTVVTTIYTERSETAIPVTHYLIADHGGNIVKHIDVTR